MTCSMTVELGAYILGAVAPQERDRIESHLIECAACRRELIALAPLPGLLLRVSAEEIESLQDRAERDPAVPLAEARRRIGRRRGRRWLIAAVASITVASGVSGGLWASGAFHTSRSEHTIVLSGSNPDSGVRLSAQLSARQWGTEVDLRMSGLPDGARCRLVVQSRTGTSEVGGSWWASRYPTTMLPTSTSIDLADISSINVVTGAGHTLIDLHNKL